MTPVRRNSTMRRRGPVSALVFVGVLGACGDFDAPNQNAGTLDELTKGTPARVAVATAAQGLLAGLRGAYAFNAQTLGILGREGYNLDVSNPQAVPAFYTLPAGSGFQNLSYWTGAYTSNKQADVVIKALDNVVGMTDAEKEGVRGFAKTLKALQLFYVIRATDQSGAALDALSDPTAPPPPIVTRDEVYTQILQWLDEAAAHLRNAGTSFPFSMTAGFAPFNTPATFLQFNRAVRAKVNITRNAFAAALTDLAGSFLDPSKPMSFGAYHTFSTNSGDATNGLFDPTARQRYAHPSYALDAQLKADGVTKDNRFTTKIRAIAPFTRYGFPVNATFTIYSTNTTPVPVIKNEELILLRAEANLALGNTSAAIADINVVRAASGGLPPISDPYVPNAALKQPPTLLDELLYEKRFSLMWENGDRWIDARRYNRLAQLPKDRPGDVVWPYLMIPVNECVPRNPKPPGCTNVPTPF